MKQVAGHVWVRKRPAGPQCSSLREVPRGGPKDKCNGSDKYGLFTAEAVHMRRHSSALIRASRQSLANRSGEHE